MPRRIARCCHPLVFHPGRVCTWTVGRDSNTVFFVWQFVSDDAYCKKLKEKQLSS